MNKGYIFGVVYESGRPVNNAIIGLDWIRGGEGPLQIYSPDADGTLDRLRALSRGLSTGMPPPLQNLNTNTDANGIFVMPFQWSGTDLGTAADNLFCQVFVLIEETSQTTVTMRLRGRFRNRMRMAVSLNQVSSGLIPDPTNPADLLGMGANLYAVIRQIRVPMIGLTVAAPSADMYSLIAGYRIAL